MALGLIGYKVGMTQVFGEDGTVHPVTVLQLGPCPVLQIRTPERDGYSAVQLGYEDKPRKKATRPEQGHVAKDLKSKRKENRLKAGIELLPKADCEPQRYVREFRFVKGTPEVEVGNKLGVTEVFGKEGDPTLAVDVVGTSKGRGFQGVMKRHNFGGMPAAHGAKKVHRQAGSTNSPGTNLGGGRPKKGLRRPGRFGNTRCTSRNLAVIKIDAENNLMLVRGTVPGPQGRLVEVRPTNKYNSTHGKQKAAQGKDKGVQIVKGKKK